MSILCFERILIRDEFCVLHKESTSFFLILKNCLEGNVWCLANTIESHTELSLLSLERSVESVVADLPNIPNHDTIEFDFIVSRLKRTITSGARNTAKRELD